MALFDVLKTDLERVKIAIEKRDSFEFSRLLPRISDAEIASLFVASDGNKMWQFLTKSYTSITQDALGRLIRGLYANPFNGVVSCWLNKAMAWCSEQCQECQYDDDGHYCSHCGSNSWQWSLLERIGLSYVVAHREVLEMVVDDFWKSALRHNGKAHFKQKLISIINRLLDRFEESIDVNASVSSIVDTDANRGELFRRLWREYSCMKLWNPDNCHKTYFEKVVRVMAFDSTEQKTLQQWALQKDELELFMLLVDTYGSDLATQTDEGFNIAMAAAKRHNMAVFKWILSKPNGESLLHHKTYNGKTFWDFAEKSKNGELMNYMRDRSRVSIPSRVRRPPANHQIRQPKRNFDADMKNPTSQLFALMKKLGYIGREHAFRCDAKNPTNDLFRIVKGLGY